MQAGLYRGIRLATSRDLARLYELLDLVDDLKQHFQGRVSPLRTIPTDADRARPKVVHGVLDPGRPAAWIHGVGLATDDQMRVEPLDAFSKRFKRASIYFDVRADNLDASCDDLSVGTVLTFIGE
jgi:hypothetical protein